jgi:hypothetical protein
MNGMNSPPVEPPLHAVPARHGGRFCPASSGSATFPIQLLSRRQAGHMRYLAYHWALASCGIATRDVSVGIHIIRTNIGLMAFPTSIVRCRHRMSDDGGCKKREQIDSKLDTVAQMRAGFSKRPNRVGVLLASKGNRRRVIFEVL